MATKSTWIGLLATLMLSACNFYQKSSPIPDGEVPKFFTLADSAALFPGRQVIAIPDNKGRAYLYFPPWGIVKCPRSMYAQFFRVEGKDVSIRSGYSRCSDPADAKALLDGTRTMKLFPGAEYKEVAGLPGLNQGLDVTTSVSRLFAGYSDGVFYHVEIEPAIPVDPGGMGWVAGRINLLNDAR